MILDFHVSISYVQDSTSASFGEEIYFKVNTSKAMAVLFDYYAKRKGVDPASLCLVFDGSTVNSTDTPKNVC